MFYSIEMVKKLGYENLDDFTSDFIKQHRESKSIFIGWRANGVYVDYDYDSEVGVQNIGYDE
jgi:hypothetical protein